MQVTHTCLNGHCYRALLMQPGKLSSCPRCDQAELLTLAYGDCQNPPRGCRMLDFKTELIQDFDQFCELVSLIGSYNAFHPSDVQREIAPIFPKLYGVEIGRESSPVIYARVPHWTHQAIEWEGFGMGSRIPFGARQALGQAFLKAMRQAGADELSEDGSVLRAWWD